MRYPLAVVALLVSSLSLGGSTGDATAEAPGAHAAGAQRYVICAVPGKTTMCRFDGRRRVRFGRRGAYRTRSFFGGVRCTPRAFGLRRPPRPGERCSYGRALVKRIRNPMAAMGPLRARRVTVPLGAKGYRRERIRRTGHSSVAARVGAFRVRCQASHLSFDDPVVYPGRPGAAHLHLFFGNTATDAHSTARSVAEQGRSTCMGGTADRTAYWVPAMVDVRRDRAVLPRYQIVYYKSGVYGVDPRTLRSIPEGLRMIAGDAKSQRPQARARWACQTAPDVRPVRVIRQGAPSIPLDCPAGNLLVEHIEFPQCWNGRSLDSKDHRSHMAYASRGCPSSHPVALPVVSYKVFYTVPRDGSIRDWRLASDVYPTSRPAGFSGHADFINGWKSSVQDTFMQHCLRAQRDCHGELLGDGTTLF